MKIHTPTRLRYAVAGVVLTLATAGCGTASADETTGDGTATGAVAFSQQIHDRLPDAVQKSGVIRLATDPSYAPMESYAADGRTIIGFEPDLAAALGAVAGVRVEMVPAEFSSMIDGTRKGTFDGVLSSMNDTPEREKKVDFIDYFSAGLAIVVQRGNPQGITDLKDLCGQVVAAEKATVQVDLLRRTQPACGDRPIVIKTFKTNADALLQVRTGRAAAILNDYPPAAYLATDPRTRSRYQLASTVQYEPGLFGIAVAKDNPELRDALRDALDQLIRSGTYTELLERWGLASGAVTTSSVNSGAEN
ncbi:ABC transporter substrate-binding protein [Actinoplanes friuliensis]|uniref:Membrane-bound lytic murein transglycosylase F n=1 Tax=Actinoplanes friuliensis DSM 7358 TaxID=1246995 RepID=U5VYH9_9ACTN|nr:ABC transporter substrate-binding protein [Actinoplanes friuliensis]AGZ41837.1 Membrane-bound lytic murein transglycosylase F [Actinoplanes friuliensis DSM 7358]